MSVKETVNQIIEERKARVDKIRDKISKINDFAKSLCKLQSTVEGFANSDNVPAELREEARSISFDSTKESASKTREALEKIENRFARKTINIGVAGNARVGKSTLLQTLSGLSDDEIPTGNGLPVTATKSCIFYDKQEFAIVKYHTEESFCQEVLIPYFHELGLKPEPNSIYDFEHFEIPTEEEFKNQNDGKDDNDTLVILERLRKAQNSLNSYKDKIGNKTKTITIGEIKNLVTYPSQEDDKKTDCPRPYLAIKELEIHTPKFNTDVDKLGIYDLPGMGEIIPEESNKFLLDFQTKMDMILLVVRPTKNEAYFKKWDSNALKNVERARKPIKNRGDFAAIIVNQSDVSQETIETCIGDINDKVNKNEKCYNIFVSTLIDKASVDENVTQPILNHLVNHLANMDKDFIDDAEVKAKSFITEFENKLREIESLLGRCNQQNKNTIQIQKDSKRLLQELSRDLAKLLSVIGEKLKSGEPSEDYEKSLDQIYNDTCDWIDNGLGYGSDENWINEADLLIKQKNGKGGLDDNERNRIRVHISEAYKKLDELLLIDITTGLFDEVANMIKKATSNLLPNELNGIEYLEALQIKAMNAYEPCNTMITAIEDFLKLKIRYKVHFHPDVRQAISPLFPTIAPTVPAPDNISPEELEELLLKYYKNLANNTNTKTRDAIDERCNLPYCIIFAALEQFIDVFIKADDSETDFYRLGLAFYDLIWPEKYAGQKSFAEDASKLKNEYHKAKECFESYKN